MLQNRFETEIQLYGLFHRRQIVVRQSPHFPAPLADYVVMAFIRQYFVDRISLAQLGPADDA
jgi:hypothetical protein